MGWRRYVTGRIENHDLDFSQGEMLGSDAAAEIARLIEMRLRNTTPAADPDDS